MFLLDHTTLQIAYNHTTSAREVVLREWPKTRVCLPC